MKGRGKMIFELGGKDIMHSVVASKNVVHSWETVAENMHGGFEGVGTKRTGGILPPFEVGEVRQLMLLV